MSGHRCPGGCSRYVPQRQVACRSCWYRLPLDLRRPITATYQRDPEAHLDALLDALRWYRENPLLPKVGGGGCHG